MAPRWRKALRDVLARRGRFLLAVFAMAVGVFQIGAMLYAYSILSGTLGTMYARTRPASAVLITDGLSDALLDSVRQVPGVADAEARPVVVGRVRVGKDEWVPGIFYVIRDFDRLRIDTFERNGGVAPPAEGEVLLEGTALSVAQVRIGDGITVRTVGDEDRPLRVAGTVHAEGLPPAWMEHMVPGFVGWNSVLRGGGESQQIRIVVSDRPLDEAAIRVVADRVRDLLQSQGHLVSWVNVPPPGRHPHAAQMSAFLFLLGAFGLLSFLLSTVLVASMIHGLLSEQVREVGIMKAIGASSAQIAGLYLGQVSLLAAAALAIGMPPGVLVGRSLARFFAGILNGRITNTGFPPWLVATEIAAGLLVPLAVALLPVHRASRITIHAALSGDSGAAPFGQRRLDRLLARIAWLPRPFMLSLRTTFLRRGRLVLNVGMLAMGGAMFISALNVGDAWNHAVDQEFRVRHYDLVVQLSEPASLRELDTVMTRTPGVAHAEYWPEGNAQLLGGDGATRGLVTLVGMDPRSTLLSLPLMAGRWLTTDDASGVVINPNLQSRDTSLHVGGVIRLRAKGRDLAWPIVGVTREMPPMPVLYAAPASVAAAAAMPPGTTRTIHVVTARHDAAAQQSVAADLERAFERSEIRLSGIQRMSDSRKSLEDHLVILLSLLTFAALIILFVGAVGLTSMLTLNVVQRTREIGILGAIGATPGTISRHVWAEGVLIGVLSWGLATLLAVPVSFALDAACGRIFFQSPLAFVMLPGPSLLWLGLVIVLASLSSFYPAWRAARLTVREALAQA
jgi:putative ABC transport system permease protein